MSKIKKVPEIRFKGYMDAWEQQKLGDITTFKKGKGYSKKDLVENGTPIILYGRLYTDYQTLITKVDTFVVEVENSVISEGWEVIVPASGESAEDISRASVVAESGIILGGDLNIINKCSLLNPVFLALAISNGNQKKEMSKRAQGKSVVHLHNSDLKEISLVFPEIKEQSLIGECFEKIDNLITLHQLKYNQVVNYKKAMLEKMFPKNGSDTPEIRFKGYTDAWEQRKLGTMITVHTSKDLIVEAIKDEGTSIVVQQGDSPILGYSNAEGFEGYINVTLFGDHTVSLYKPQLPFVVATDGVKILSSSILHHQYFYTVLEKYKPIPQGYKRHFSILKEQIANITVNKNEQKKIGEIFEIIDDLIALHQRKLQQLKNIKKAMLEKMLV